MIVIAIFGLVVASIFAAYPQTVLSVWVAMPLAVLFGWWIRRRPGANILMPGLGALAILYASVWLGAYYLPVDLGLPLFGGADVGYIEGLRSSVVAWTLILLAYCFIASVLPVGMLLQPRDYLNSLQLYVALALLVGGLFIAVPAMVAPAWNPAPPGDAPAIFPFLFITIACGAVSGFHCLVSSGTSSKQLDKETDARFVGYGAMLMEGALAVLVILACCAGLGMGIYDTAGGAFTPILGDDGAALTGAPAWQAYYGTEWMGMRLAN
jgi:carbon starvation protein